MKMSSSSKRSISADEFFYVVEDNYDDHVELAIPLYHEMHTELVRLLRAKENLSPWRVLDLGSGTGRTALPILRDFTVSSLEAIDLFEVMHAHARSRLALFEPKVTFVKGDFMDVPFNGPFDVCVSALAIHHQNSSGKRRLFQKIYSCLSDEGVFVMIDWMNFAHNQLNHLAFESAVDSLSAKVFDSHIIANWIEHWKTKNIPDTVEAQLTWLSETGFSLTHCPMRFWGMAMIVATKSLNL